MASVAAAVGVVATAVAVEATAPLKQKKKLKKNNQEPLS